MPTAASVLSLADLRRHAARRTLFAPTSLQEALTRLAFVQADPIRAPARAQDLTLRHRAVDYRAGELERRYATLDLDEGYFVNYGFLSREDYALLHPRAPRRPWSALTKRRAEALLAFANEHGLVRPREADAHFAHGRVVNYWGGQSSATTHLLDGMHYRGLLRVAQRERGVRIYAPHVHPVTPNDAATRRAHLDRLVDVVVQAYAPLPAASLSQLTHRIRYRTPARAGELRAAVARAKERLAHARVDGIAWYWPAGEDIAEDDDRDPAVSLLAPFDPIVWDRRRFELFWGWAYRFEAYVPPPRRKLGYYALPLLYRDQVIGWGNVSVQNGRIDCQLGFVTQRPRDPRFRRALDAELARLEAFLG